MKLNMYLTFDGNCEEAINFYKDVFEGEITILSRFREAPPGIMQVPAGSENLIMPATLEFQECILMASDTIDREKFASGTNYSLSVNIADADKASAVYHSLVEGGNATMPFVDAFWGGKFGMLVDKFGIHWMVSSEH